MSCLGCQRKGGKMQFSTRLAGYEDAGKSNPSSFSISWSKKYIAKEICIDSQHILTLSPLAWWIGDYVTA